MLLHMDKSGVTNLERTDSTGRILFLVTFPLTFSQYEPPTTKVNTVGISVCKEVRHV